MTAYVAGWRLKQRAIDGLGTDIRGREALSCRWMAAGLGDEVK